MPSIQRLQWLAAEIHQGRTAFGTFSSNSESKKEKVKFTLEDSHSSHGAYRPCIMAALSGIQVARQESIVTKVMFFVQSRKFIPTKEFPKVDVLTPLLAS